MPALALRDRLEVGADVVPHLGSDYFELTGPGPAVFITVLPALVLWFAALTATLRFRLLDRALGLDHLRA